MLYNINNMCVNQYYEQNKIIIIKRLSSQIVCIITVHCRVCVFLQFIFNVFFFQLVLYCKALFFIFPFITRGIIHILQEIYWFIKKGLMEQ